MSEALQTPLTAWHQSAGAKMAPFAGWEMPIQYEGILAEHIHTRTQAAIFDICHMGEVLLRGPGIQEALAKAVSHNLATLKPARCRYGFLLNEQGGILDDLIIYHLPENKGGGYMAVLNASRTEGDIQAFRDRLSGFDITDISGHTAKIDLQGPKSFEALSGICAGEDVKVSLEELRGLPYFAFMYGTYNGADLMISRTGYTGEFGYELYIDSAQALPLWEALVAHPLVKPAGLGARDTLRLESGLPLYGQDLDTEHTPAEANYGAMLTSEADYVGKGADRQIRRSLTALAIQGRRSARHGDMVALADKPDTIVGEVTSGSFGPSLNYCMALAYIDAAHAGATDFIVKGPRAELPARRVDLPFYKDGTARMKL